MKDIFEFNYIDKSLSESEIESIKDFYKHYHKKCWCFKKSYKRYKYLDLILAISGGCLIVLGTVTGGATVNLIILGVLNRIGVILTSFGEMMNCKTKIEMTTIAFTTYEKVLVELRTALRGDKFDKNKFIEKMKVID